MELTHASFFSGVGGTDLGLEAAGWRTVSFSEIDPYANAVLAERWPGVPNIGDITAGVLHGADAERVGQRWTRSGGERNQPDGRRAADGGDGWRTATLWSGGFPCQDLSVAGKRAGFAGERSVLAFAFLDLVRQHRPPAVLLENVPGLLSSHRGRDMAALVGLLAELRYGWAYRILDARHFGVPQRRRRVFIVALDLDRGFTADSAAAVLAVGTRCDRHPATGHPTGAGVAGGTGDSPVGALRSRDWKGIGFDFEINGQLVSPTPDPGGVREADGLAGRAHDRTLAATLNSGGNDGGFRTEPGEPLIEGNGMMADDLLLPLGLDSHRYRCCGNGVVAPVAEWIGHRLAAALDG